MNKAFIITFVIIFAGYLNLKKRQRQGVFLFFKKEVFACYYECKEFLSGLFFCLKANSKRYFEEVKKKKKMIQYILTVSK